MMMIIIIVIIIIGTDTIYLNHGSQSLLKLSTAFDQVIPAINGVSIAVQEDISGNWRLVTLVKRDA